MSSSANVQSSARPMTARAWALPVLLVVGFIVRLFFVGSAGFTNDVQAFESWAITLATHPFSQFYAKAGFADYPPGYFYILAIVGQVWEHFFRSYDTSYSVLRLLVKLPAIVADLLTGLLIFRLVSRLADERWAFAAAAMFILNPAVIVISAMWGQVDAIAGGLALLALYWLVCSSDDEAERPSWYIVGAWLALSYSLLIKPQAAALVPLFIAFVFTDPHRRTARLGATAAGIALAVMLAIGLSEPFAPSHNPIAALGWLLQRYQYGTGVYPYNSINAFNLWTIGHSFWSPDSNPILGLPQYLWGMILASCAGALVIWRYLQSRTPRSLVEAAGILLLAFFILSTRMHERYLFDGLLLIIASAAFARRYLVAAIVLSITLLINLDYALQYLSVVSSNVTGIDAADMWPFLTRALSLINVGTFFYLGYMFLGTQDSAMMSSAVAPARPRIAIPAVGVTPSGPRGWFDPREGLERMRWPLDYIVAAALGIFSFVLSYVNYWFPKEKVFDEIYFARAGEEYLKHAYIYENTHPPLTKLLIAGSMLLFGGLHGLGDTSVGWRFMDVVFGALVVVLLYLFAKRVTGSTVFAAIAALFLTFDGMHFVQSRIATPEGIVVFFSLAAVYAFYRFWIASQVNVRDYLDERERFAAPICAVIALASGFILSWLIVAVVYHQDRIATVVAGLYAACGLYCLLRMGASRMLRRGAERSYAEGSRSVLFDDGASAMYAADGGILDSRAKTPRRGAVSQARGSDLLYETEELEIVYRRDGTVTYRAPVGEATYAPDEIRTDGVRQRGRDAKLWLVVFTVALGALVASKWYGVMAFGVSFVMLVGIWLQRFVFERRPTLWGNPRGFRLDVALASIVFIAATVYALVWIPDAIRHIPGEVQNLNDLVKRQYDMFEYHDTLKATHPYQSSWWQWPLDLRPIAYYYKDQRIDPTNPRGCCVAEIVSLPNPLILWFGLLCVPLVGYLAWKERNKAYALLVVTYLLQWLPWMRSPRITFAYHFYVDIPLICLCNAIVLQRLWQWGSREGKSTKIFAGVVVGACVALVGLSFVWFYPILAGTGLPWYQWDARMLHKLLGYSWV